MSRTYEDTFPLRVEMVCAMRVLARKGCEAPWSAGHASTKIANDLILINRWGPSFATVMPDDILLVDLDRNTIAGKGRHNNTTVLHCEIHRAVVDANTVVHTHPPSVLTFGHFWQLPEFYDQDSCPLAGSIMLLERTHESMDLGKTNADPVAQRFASQPDCMAMIAPNHGSFTWGRTLVQAFWYTLVLEHVCKSNLDVARVAPGMSSKPRPIPLEAAKKIRQQQEGKAERGLDPDGLNLVWEDMLRRLADTDADLLLLREKYKNTKVW